MLGRVIGGIIGLDARILELARILHAAGILWLFPLLAPTASPTTLQGSEENVGSLCHRCRTMPMMPMMVDDAGFTRSIIPPRWRAIRDLVVPELRGAFRELTASVQVQSGSLWGASVTCKSKTRVSIRLPAFTKQIEKFIWYRIFHAVVDIKM